MAKVSDRVASLPPSRSILSGLGPAYGNGTDYRRQPADAADAAAFVRVGLAGGSDRLGWRGRPREFPARAAECCGTRPKAARSIRQGALPIFQNRDAVRPDCGF